MNVFTFLKNWAAKEKTYADHWFEIDERLRFITVGLVNTVVRYLILSVWAFGSRWRDIS